MTKTTELKNCYIKSENIYYERWDQSKKTITICISDYYGNGIFENKL